MAQYSAALSSFTTIDATDDPTAEELARILVKVAKEDDLTPETIDWIHQQLLSNGSLFRSNFRRTALKDNGVQAQIPKRLGILEQLRWWRLRLE
jgi:hypothetical protein